MPLMGIVLAACQLPAPPVETQTTETEPIVFDPNDRDRDGFVAPEDCNDDDPTIFPGAPERCDGVDRNCDGQPDRGIVTVSGGRSFGTVADALEVAVDGDHVVVCPGVYRGASTASVSVTIVGFDPSDPPTLDAAGAGPALRVTAPGVVLRDLHLTGGTEAGLRVEGGGVVDASNLLIDDNLGRTGGGVHVSGAGSVLRDSEVRANVADQHGGGVFVDGELTLVRTRIAGNAATQQGGGLAVALDGRAQLDDVEIESNSAVRGAGAFLFLRAEVAAGGATRVHQNTASESGGGVYLTGGAWRGGSLSDNTASTTGGGLYVVDGGALDHLTLARNTARQGAGGLIRGPITIGELEAADNVATQDGGGLYLLDAIVTGERLIARDNTAPAGAGLFLRDSDLMGASVVGNRGTSGAGVTVSNVTNVKSILRDLTIRDNRAETTGGGMFTLSTLDLYDSVIRANVASDRAGGLIAAGDIEVRLFGATIDSNAASQRGGGLYTIDDAELRVTDSTLTHNQALRGGGLYLASGQVVLTRTAVLANGDATTINGGGARLIDGELVVITSDWGEGEADNQSDDVYTNNAGAFLGYGAASTFTCDANGCSPAP